MNIELFSQLEFLPALKSFFRDLKVPINHVTDEPTTAKEILKDTYKDNDTFQLIEDVFFVGMVDDATFEGNKSLEKEKIKSDYDGILIFGVTLIPRLNGLLPTRSQLADIARAFNREFYYTPVVVVFKYGNLLALANTERLKYKQEWREGEKAGKVSLLRDINIEKPHRGHNDILQSLRIPITGKYQVDSFTKLYSHWQEVFSVSVLNKKFYQELSTWYFWATKHVSFPGEPTVVDEHHKKATLEDLQQEHRATNVIRMLTRLLFVWFIKEKKLIPEELFDLDTLQTDILNEISPYHETGIFKERNKESIYYKAILQNLFFATLNCPIEGDSLDTRKRGFRGEESKGKHFAIDWMMRYKKYFKNPAIFIDLVNSKTPFLNGGLFECLDDKPNKILIDGFSDNQTVQQQLIVPDYLFFGLEEEADISDIVGIADKKYKNAAVKGLLNILKSYKFTITENTPIEEDVALDPELLGKVFENLLASYNPETKTTARKQTGSFYTPREIVNYMVDESLIAYLKNKIQSEHSTYSEFGRTQTNLFGNGGGTGQQKLQIDLTGSELKENGEQLDNLLHELVSFNPGNPFVKQPNTTQIILNHLSTCTILDPACGSGAFPMGILQKMVHILQKLDPDNILWRKVQEVKAKKEAEEAFDIDDKEARNERLNEISDAFDQSINDPDYARKLFLIENCIYGVDIQPIATQISKLRFFISLVVEQKVNLDRTNFGIRPLPNLETKFVAANTLIGIGKSSSQLSLYGKKEIKTLEKELRSIRHKLFNARSKETKLKYRIRDKDLRNTIAVELQESGWRHDTSKKLASWDPYDQNEFCEFFDPEWMFGITEGFDIVIGNPPYLGNKEIGAENQKTFKAEFGFTDDMYHYFYNKGINFLKESGTISFITPNTFLTLTTKQRLRKLFLENVLQELYLVGFVFDSAYVDTAITIIQKKVALNHNFRFKVTKDTFEKSTTSFGNISLYRSSPGNIFYPPTVTNILVNSIVNNSLINTYNEFKESLQSQNKLKSNHSKLNAHRNSLTEGNTTFLGLIAEGGQGLVTGNNSKYLANIYEDEEVRYNIDSELTSRIDNYFGNKSSSVFNRNELYTLAEQVKTETKNPAFFGKFFLYKTVNKKFVKKFSELSITEQKNGVDAEECWIYYSRGNEEGFKWKVPYVEAINWTVVNVKELKDGKLTNSRWQGSDFYDKTGFGWVDYFTNQIKSFFVEEGPYSKNVVKFHSNAALSDKFLTGLLNSKFITYYVKNFITNTHTLQINDGKLIPIKYPSYSLQKLLDGLVTFIFLKKSTLLENIIDALVLDLYFSEHMSERNISVKQLVEGDFNEILNGLNIEELDDNEKSHAYDQLHQKWNHPDNEVRNRIKLFAVRSPEILKPILES